MRNFNTPLFDAPKTWIEGRRKDSISWDDIRNGLGIMGSIDAFLKNMKDMCVFPSIDKDTWMALVEYMQNEEEAKNLVADSNKASVILGVNQDNTLSIPTHKNSAWKNYRDKLLKEKGYSEDAVKNIEKSCIETLRCLSRRTDLDDPRKGLVVGSVQSGKTGQMAGLMAMAADWGWNMFIVFSGSLENLREQTEKRLIADLNNRRAHFNWLSLPRPAAHGNIDPGYSTSQLDFTEQSRMKYLTVCLKNTVRMNNLLDWLHSDQNTLSNIKVLLIDDEADQATINTLPVGSAQRTALNDAMCKLVNGKRSDGTLSRGLGAMNYVAYTATPYANLLNESSEESLYPKHFIATLEPSKEYFGPQQIFGDSTSSYDGLDIVREISDDEIDEIHDLYSKPSVCVDDMPAALANSICWFICCVANMRASGYNKPLSMLVHTSMKTDHHSRIAELISVWLNQDRKYILDSCHDIWNKETNKFTLSNFVSQYHDYARLDHVSDYMPFASLMPHLNDLLNDIRPIQIDDKGVMNYHKGLHLCVDNSKEGITANNEHIRLLYPDTALDFASAFIVIGGNTLSRGLTIEGLVSSYFFRTVKQADTLMQMGRWFGYRRGYELLPRIWLTNDALDKFQYLTLLDTELRSEIVRMSTLGLIPSKYAARIRNLPSYIKITARNRMQSAIEADMDFSGTLLQTFMFDNDDSVLQSNLDLTDAFISSLGDPAEYDSYSSSNVIWQHVDNDIVSQYLQSYRFNQSIKRLNDIQPLLDWLKEIYKASELDKWNVVLCGVQNNNQYKVGNVSVGKVTRSKLKSPNDIINIKGLTSPSDFISDLNKDNMSDDIKQMIRSGIDTRTIRLKSELSKCPQLLIYIIDKDSKAKVNTSREDLNSNVDIVGVAINIPGSSDCTNNTRTVCVRLDADSLIDLNSSEDEDTNS